MGVQGKRLEFLQRACVSSTLFLAIAGRGVPERGQRAAARGGEAGRGGEGVEGSADSLAEGRRVRLPACASLSHTHGGEPPEDQPAEGYAAAARTPPAARSS